MYLQTEMLDHMVAYHRERIEAAMRAGESDRAVMLKYRARLGSLLISLGQRLRGDGVPNLTMTPPLRIQPQGKCA